MANKKLQKSIDTVKGDVRELVEAFWAFRDEVMTQQAVSAAERQSASPTGKNKKSCTTLPKAADVRGSGQVGTVGYYEMPDEAGGKHAYRWALADHPVDELLSVPVDDAAKLLAAVGHKQRLSILLMLLRQPATAAEIVSTLSLGTTGAAYHHLNVLQGSGVVQQAQRGVFAVVPERVPSLLTILAGLSETIELSVDPVEAETPDEPATEASESADA